MKKLVVTLITGVLALGAISARGQLVNLGFEDGLNGWTPATEIPGAVEVLGVTQLGYSAPYGSYYAMLTTGEGNVPTELSQTADFEAGDQVAVSAAFWTSEVDDWDTFTPYMNDFASASIYQGAALVEVLWAKDVDAVGGGGHSAWEEWVWTAPSAGTYTVVLQVTNAGDAAMPSHAFFDCVAIGGPGTGDPTDPGPLTVMLDIKPGSDTNPINLKSKGVLPAAILGTADYDVKDIDLDSILLGGTGNGVAPVRSSWEDVNGDGFLDLSLKFDMAELAAEIDADITELVITGEDLDGAGFSGADIVTVVPCKKK